MKGVSKFVAEKSTISLQYVETLHNRKGNIMLVKFFHFYLEREGMKKITQTKMYILPW